MRYDPREAVRRGGALLDHWVPGWAGQIDVHRLDMASLWDCVLGQLFAPACKLVPGHLAPNPVNLAEGLFLPLTGEKDPHEMLTKYGFALPDDYDGRDYETLQPLWLEEIRRRRT